MKHMEKRALKMAAWQLREAAWHTERAARALCQAGAEADVAEHRDFSGRAPASLTSHVGRAQDAAKQALDLRGRAALLEHIADGGREPLYGPA